MTAAEQTLPLSVLDFVGIEHGETAHESVSGAVGIARAVEQAGYRRYWVSEHHNMRSLACSAPEILTAHVAARTERIRVGAAGIMLPNHAAFKVAETFRTLLALHPGRIDLALGRAPGTDPLTAHVLRRGIDVDPAAEFPQQVGELLAFLGDGFPAGHPYGRLVAAPVVDEQPELFVLGSSRYGPRFAAVNGMSAVFAHHMSPEIAVEVLRDYRRDFDPRPAQPDAVLGHVRADLRQRRPGGGARLRGRLGADDAQPGARHPRAAAAGGGARLRPLGGLPARAAGRVADGHRRAEGGGVAAGELKEQARVDEIVVVTPGLDRDRRTDSFRSIADAWRRG